MRSLLVRVGVRSCICNATPILATFFLIVRAALIFSSTAGDALHGSEKSRLEPEQRIDGDLAGQPAEDMCSSGLKWCRQLPQPTPF